MVIVIKEGPMPAFKDRGLLLKLHIKPLQQYQDNSGLKYLPAHRPGKPFCQAGPYRDYYCRF